MISLWYNLPWLRFQHLSVLVPCEPEVIRCLLKASLDIHNIGFHADVLPHNRELED
jgi:hypothetical protein